MITLTQAQTILAAAVQKAEALGTQITATVVDAYGVIVATVRMDGALVVSPKYAQAKAYTAATLRLPTATIAQYATPGKPYYGTTSAFEGEMMVIAGGIPIMENNIVIGAIGVGGSADVDQDVACAQAGIEALKR